MNYRHIYHAGNLADLFKHIVLMALLQHMARKETPFFVLDTHAGIGLYDLHSSEAAKTREYQQGIGQLFPAAATNPLLEDFLKIVKAINPDGDLQAYPGSPVIIAHLLRERDRAACCELHPEDFTILRRVLRTYTSVTAHQRDGYEAIKALLPPVQKRGLILIDPPFEAADELDRIVAAVSAGSRRFPAAIWALWYPIKDRAAIWRFHEALAAVDAPQLALEFMSKPEIDSRQLNGSGLLLVRPPYQFEETIIPALTELRQALHLSATGLTREWIRADA